jgi:two-component system chemotaxis response regulator CheY
MRTRLVDGERNSSNSAWSTWNEAGDVLRPRGTANRAFEILVVDDDRAHRAVVRRVLSRAGFDVHEAENGVRAYEHLVRPMDSLPGLVIVDGQMPVMNGWELAAKMTRDPRLAQVPIIMLSGTKQPLAPSEGIREFFEKPFDTRRLVAAVRKHCVSAEHGSVPQRSAD